PTLKHLSCRRRLSQLIRKLSFYCTLPKLNSTARQVTHRMRLRFRSYRRPCPGPTRRGMHAPMPAHVHERGRPQKPLRPKIRADTPRPSPSCRPATSTMPWRRSWSSAPCQGEGDRSAPPPLQVERSWGWRRESNATSANYDLAALPLSYTGPRCRTLCDGLASYN